MKISGIVFFILFGAVCVFIICMRLRDGRRKRLVVALLAARVQRDDEPFGREFFPDAKRADIARRARRVLSRNLQLSLGGLKPSDRLNEDLNAELIANPNLFWDLEAEFGIKTGIGDEDVESFLKTLETLATFQDLVEFVGRRIA